MTTKKVEKEEQIVAGPVTFDVKLADGLLVLTVSVDPSVYLDKIAAAIPGTVDDKVITAVKALLTK